MAEKEASVKKKRLTIEILRQMFTLATSGFGLVMALAWNNVIQAFVNDYIKKYFPGSGLMTLFFYALLVTALAVAVTLQLSRVLERLEPSE
ncbi:MAG: hypothetical protein KGJ07_01300 [Patescibacteria group bacterium]|nr:hypothetical protein [Patescibacteria group bacterium]MDE2590898.1 hypothetical protein [Patescibacteria group bacterium]